MSNFTSRQWAAIAGGVLLLTGLFFINRKAPPSADNPTGGQQQGSGHTGNAIDFEQVIQESEDSLSGYEKQLVSRIKDAISNTDSAHIRITGHLINSLDSVGQPIIAAYYMEKLAESVKSPVLWVKAGNKFFDYAELGKDNFKIILLQQAKLCFTSSIKLDSNNADARVGLGECIVEGGGPPMVGISTILSVLNKDSNNLNAQFVLGKLSIKSNQIDKAIYRFNRVLQIDPTYYKAYLMLAQTYKSKGNIKEEIVNLKKYRTFAADSAFKVELDKYLEEEQKNDTTE